jgi:hypothetical protein
LQGFLKLGRLTVDDPLGAHHQQIEQSVEQRQQAEDNADDDPAGCPPDGRRKG